MTSIPNEVTAKYVPAAAVIRMWQALFGITGHNARRRFSKLTLKSPGSTREQELILLN